MVEAQHIAAVRIGVADHGIDVGQQVGADRDPGRGAVLDRIEALFRMQLGDLAAVAQQPHIGPGGGVVGAAHLVHRVERDRIAGDVEGLAGPAA